MTAQLKNPVETPSVFGAISCAMERRPAGDFVVRCATPLSPCPDSIVDVLRRHAAERPDNILFREQDAAGQTTGISCGDFYRSASRIAGRILDWGASRERPVAIIAENSISTALAIVGCYLAGVPVAPISPAYSRMSTDFAKLSYVLKLLTPAILIVDDGADHAPAIARCAGEIDVIVAMARPQAGHRNWDDLTGGSAQDADLPVLRPDDIAKILFTSGSTGMPKGVINTHRMMISNQQAMRQLWPRVADKPLRLVDWLPWNHTFGGNQNFNLALFNGGMMHIDRGKPTPQAIAATIRAIKATRPTMYFNVPRGLDLLAQELRKDGALREALFADLDVLVYAGAALPPSIWTTLRDVSRAVKGYAIPVTGSWGSTETGPLATAVYFDNEHAGNLGLPIPGCDVRFVPDGSKMEMRVRAPSVTPGYWRQPDLTQAMFDEEGFYKIGDAGRLVDPHRLDAGILFDGRIGENFKLLSGTWVTVGMLRVAVIAACPDLIADTVIAGHNQNEATALLFPKLAACVELAGDTADPSDMRAVLSCARVKERIARGLAAHNKTAGGSSNRIARAILLSEPPSIDGNEITDKGYLNQRAVLERRAAEVERLYSAAPDDAVIIVL